MIIVSTFIILIIKIKTKIKTGEIKMKTLEKLENGIYFTKNGITYNAQDLCLTHHDGEMPAYHTENFKSTRELLRRMRGIAPLTHWKNYNRD